VKLELGHTENPGLAPDIGPGMGQARDAQLLVDAERGNPADQVDRGREPGPTDASVAEAGADLDASIAAAWERAGKPAIAILGEDGSFVDACPVCLGAGTRPSRLSAGVPTVCGWCSGSGLAVRVSER
jgi:hypothetical protein